MNKPRLITASEREELREFIAFATRAFGGLDCRKRGLNPRLLMIRRCAMTAASRIFRCRHADIAGEFGYVPATLVRARRAAWLNPEMNAAARMLCEKWNQTRK